MEFARLPVAIENRPLFDTGKDRKRRGAEK